MFLKRIQVNDYKVLKDIDISFEENFTPKVFPLGSLNGGGKSTLLQLIFTLLNCSFDENKKSFVKNIIESIEVKDTKKTLAKIDIILIITYFVEKYKSVKISLISVIRVPIFAMIGTRITQI